MCILFAAVNQHPNYPLIIAANRDEFYQRATSPAHRWSDQYQQIFAGKDNQANGTWLGVNTSGQFAAVTNVRQGLKEPNDKKSRGELPLLALSTPQAIDYTWLQAHSDNYNAFNLIYGSLSQLYCYNSVDKSQTPLTDGFHAICNGKLDDIWPKMAKGSLALKKLVLANENLSPHALVALLKDNTQAPDSLLPKTGIPMEWERLLSSIFITSGDYGTRCSTILFVDKQKQLSVLEVSYDDKGQPTQEQTWHHQLS